MHGGGGMEEGVKGMKEKEGGREIFRKEVREGKWEDDAF